MKQLNLIGTTIGNGVPYIFFPSNQFDFESVEIGLNEYPIQNYELYNAGEVEAKVEIESELFRDFNKKNYMTEILKCVSDKVVKIPPGCSVETKWKFIPIEAKTYKVNKLSYL